MKQGPAKSVQLKGGSLVVQVPPSVQKGDHYITKGNMVFNRKVIIAPNRIVDYVVVHELCHLHHHNHSPKFWKCVERVFPDYAESKEWLKTNAGTLFI